MKPGNFKVMPGFFSPVNYLKIGPNSFPNHQDISNLKEVNLFKEKN